MKKILQEFKKFITRGNIVDMAVGVLIGSAFTAIVNALTKQIFQPFINWILAGTGGGLESAVTMLKRVVDPTTGAVDMVNSIYIDWGAFITAVINFLLIAIVLFAVVKIINGLRDGSKARRYGYSHEEYYTMRRAGMKRKAIKAAAKARDDEAAAKAEAEANAPKPETQEDILRDIRALLAANAQKNDTAVVETEELPPPTEQ